ncbi:MAG: DTW domain-containing protein [Labilithrix sp.]|nr:DTW domain-containing protein [Labilithrix sp.]MCW5814831.1 DTW domain-containing protein [Labilithrix sp.]
MSRRANYGHRCKACMMHMSLCICALIPRLETRTRLVLVMHKAELRKPTNTGHIATLALTNSATVVRGREGEPEDEVTWPEGTEPVLLFPHEGAEPLTARDRPVTLIVPDGNWRQASKVRARVPGLRDVRCATLPLGPPTEYRLRLETHPAGLATIEAIARAFGILEGPEVQAALEGIFRTMVERTLWIRGSIPTDAVKGGIPEGVDKHDPRSGREKVRP